MDGYNTHGDATGKRGKAVEKMLVQAFNETKPPFIVGGEELMFPGDKNGSPWNVYNCRCAMRTVEKPGIQAEPRQIRVRDPITGKNVVVSDMTYSEWLEWKENLEKSAKNGIIRQPMNLQLFAEQDLKKQTTKSLKRGIDSLTKNIEEHKVKIKNPEKYVDGWESYSEKRKAGLIKHWNKEISNFEESKNNRSEELKQRGK